MPLIQDVSSSGRMNTICNAARAAEKKLAEKLMAEEQNPVQQICLDGSLAARQSSEQTITDNLIDDLSRIAGDRFRVIPTTSHAEARRFGADWMWAVKTRFGVYGGLVQAKRGYPPIGSSDARTIEVTDRPNDHTGIGQLTTLRQTSEQLAIASSYAVYCLQESYVPKCKAATGPHSIHFVTADTLSEGDISLPIASDHSVTLSELLCCAGSKQGATLGNVPVLTRRIGSIEDLVQAARQTNQVRKILRVDLT